jgi:serine/threonine protein phosphatase PrpC
MSNVTLGGVLRDSTWCSIVRSIDRVLAGGPQTTIVACALVGDHLIGVVAGDSRIYHVALDGVTLQLAASASKVRAGSGDVAPLTFHWTVCPKDTIVLCSDGLWTAIGRTGIDSVVRSWTTKPAADLPTALLDAVRGAPADDCTVVTMRI